VRQHDAKSHLLAIALLLAIAPHLWVAALLIIRALLKLLSAIGIVVHMLSLLPSMAPARGYFFLHFYSFLLCLRVHKI